MMYSASKTPNFQKSFFRVSFRISRPRFPLLAPTWPKPRVPYGVPFAIPYSVIFGVSSAYIFRLSFRIAFSPSSIVYS
jgi:hypothetical protein